MNWKTKNVRDTMPCGVCGETLTPAEECQCNGTPRCPCEFLHHHIGCCGSYILAPANPEKNWEHELRYNL